MSINIFVPIISSFLYRWGGTNQWSWCPINQKLWRWLGIGLFVGIIYSFLLHLWTPLLAILSYTISFHFFPYGDTSYLRKWFKSRQIWLFYGFLAGLASFPIVGYKSIYQAIFSSVVFFALMWASNEGIKQWKD